MSTVVFLLFCSLGCRSRLDWVILLVGGVVLLSSCDGQPTYDDSGVDAARVYRGAADGATEAGNEDVDAGGDACAPACRLGSDGTSCLCVDDFGRDVYCRDVEPAGTYWRSCCGRACR